MGFSQGSISFDSLNGNGNSSGNSLLAANEGLSAYDNGGVLTGRLGQLFDQYPLNPAIITDNAYIPTFGGAAIIITDQTSPLEPNYIATEFRAGNLTNRSTFDATVGIINQVDFGSDTFAMQMLTGTSGNFIIGFNPAGGGDLANTVKIQDNLAVPGLITASAISVQSSNIAHDYFAKIENGSDNLPGLELIHATGSTYRIFNSIDNLYISKNGFQGLSWDGNNLNVPSITAGGPPWILRNYMTGAVVMDTNHFVRVNINGTNYNLLVAV